jgi:hypothetical protein
MSNPDTAGPPMSGEAPARSSHHIRRYSGCLPYEDQVSVIDLSVWIAASPDLVFDLSREHGDFLEAESRWCLELRIFEEETALLVV